MPSDAGAQAHHRALESLYAAAPVNELFQSRLRIPESGRSVIDFEVEEGLYHAAGAAHGTIYFKMLDDAARSEEHPSELQSLMRISYAVFCLKNKKAEAHHARSYRSTQTNLFT